MIARVPTAVHLCATNRRYLAAKAGRGSHELDLEPLRLADESGRR